MTPFSAILVND
jgi:aminopeptidase 2